MGASFYVAVVAAAVMILIDADALIFDSCAAGLSRNAFDREVARHSVARELEQHDSSRHEP